MPTGKYIYDETYIADAAIAAYRAVVNSVTRDHVKYPASQDANGIAGISQHATTASGDTLVVRKDGISKIEVASGNITCGVDLRVHNAVGQVDRQTVAWASGDGIIGQAEETSNASGDIIECWLRIRTAH